MTGVGKSSAGSYLMAKTGFWAVGLGLRDNTGRQYDSRGVHKRGKLNIFDLNQILTFHFDLSSSMLTTLEPIPRRFSERLWMGKVSVSDDSK